MKNDLYGSVTFSESSNRIEEILQVYNESENREKFSIRFYSIPDKQMGLELAEALSEVPELYVSIFNQENSLQRNHKDDYSFIRNFHNCNLLSIRRAPGMKDLDWIVDLKKLKEFKIEEAAISPLSICPIRKLSKLEHLYLNNPMSDLEKVAECSSLSQITFQNNGIKNLNFLKNNKLSSLKKLKIWYVPKMVSIQGIGSLASLEELELYDLNKIETLPDFSPLRNLRVLRIFDLKQCKMISGLQNLKKLETIEILGSKKIPVESLKGLRDLPNLKFGKISLPNSKEFVPVLE